MNDDAKVGAVEPTRPIDFQALGSSTLLNLIEAFISLRGRNESQHKFFEQTLSRLRDDMKSSWNSFVEDTQRAYVTLRKEVQGEKKFSLGLLNEMLEFHDDLQHIVAARPPLEDAEALKRWVEAIEIESRKVQTALVRHGIKEYDAVIGSPYNPAL